MNMSWGGYEPAKTIAYIKKEEEEYNLKLTWKEKYELERLVRLEIDNIESVIAFLEEKEKDTSILEKDLEIYRKLLKKLEEVK
jgi:hypothetical protein